MQMRLCMIITLCAWGIQAHAQSQRITWDQLGSMYSEARFQLVYQAYIESNQEYVPPLGPARFSLVSDSLLTWIRSTMGLKDAPPKSFEGEIHTWTLISPENRTDWLTTFGDIQWSYLGNNFFTAMDTVVTPKIRARLQAYFGIPTQTAVESKQGDPTPADDNSQFEYWFVVNDSIPMMVMDVLGPFDRGIIVATHHQFRSLLYRMRQSLLAAVMRDAEPVQYIDYYYHLLTRQWYLTGYDGTDYFAHRIRTPDLKLGRPVQAGQSTQDNEQKATDV